MQDAAHIQALQQACTISSLHASRKQLHVLSCLWAGQHAGSIMLMADVMHADPGAAGSMPLRFWQDVYRHVDKTRTTASVAS